MGCSFGAATGTHSENPQYSSGYYPPIFIEVGKNLAKNQYISPIESKILACFEQEKKKPLPTRPGSVKPNPN
ncbi:MULTISPECIES: hypothetical protein [unclassified Moorena]|uniref:hypothetical protein n=1 Tax=unclassified Moorena TaxID=2683338 RepID=UPI0013FFFAA3|nr:MULTISPECIES: hypothetical protein [unclassified Moorena]NEO17523.1 hypothetical protein [Moorena sp. SIO3E8]NEQ04055.1 hypothetical protein [Moorena sp. SIO3F7]